MIKNKQKSSGICNSRKDEVGSFKIEEFYDSKDDTSCGMNGDSDKRTVSVGVKVVGQKVTKRVYYFKGSSE